MSRRPRSSPAELLGDPGVLGPEPALEAFGSAAVAAVGGVAVLPLRGDWLRARAADVVAVPWWPDAGADRFAQVVVHLQKGRAATWQALAEGWRRLDPGGRLLLLGGNDLGVKSAVKRLAAELDAPGEVVANRAHARAVCWRRDDGAGPREPVAPPVAVAAGGAVFQLPSAPGIFSADGVDPGTALLLEHLVDLDAPELVFDPGCGIGVLGLAALRRWPTARAVLADADHRAVTCARAGAVELGLDGRCEAAWWDAENDPPPLPGCDLVLLNPPFHSGVPVDLQPARAIFRAVDTVLAPGGRALVVANRTLPWERDLERLGALRRLTDRSGYKVLEVAR
ncbi:MAG TPA: methyltransferase [Methylomirabilota bacterium]|nr:methyltransferase [Methylomirabilota bacterium]